MKKLFYTLALHKGRKGCRLYSEHKHNICPYKHYTKIGSVHCVHKCKYFISDNLEKQYVECRINDFSIFKKLFKYFVKGKRKYK
jgi:hypothetical protein